MESAKICQDFLKEYQTILENEKRRLNSVTEKSNDVTEMVGQTPSVNNSQKDNQLLSEMETPVLKQQQIVHVDPKEGAKHDNRKQTEMMEQWVTDSFYTSFPSFKSQDLNANRLADDRREDYRKYLAEVSNKKLLDAGRSNRRRTEEHSDSELLYSKQPETPRDRLLHDLKHSELAYNFHNPNAIDDRNQKVAMERARKKVELQQELFRQIEEKKLQIAKIRAKEKEEEEILQKRLENQMKALQVTDELTKMNDEKVLINKTSTAKNPVPRRDTESRTDHYRAEDGSPENRTRNDVNANSDRQIYKFFSNSAPHNDGHVNYYNQPVGFNNMTITNPYSHHISTAAHNPTQHCNRCRREVPIMCSSCCHNDLNPSHFCCYRCNLLQNMDACNNCRRAWVQSWSHHGDVERNGFSIHQRDHRAQILEITYQDHSSQTNISTTPPPKSDRIQAIRSDSPDTSGYEAQNNNRPVMTHSDKIVGIGSTVSKVPEAVSLSKEQEMLELKRKNDILIAKYARNYGSLRKRQPVPKETTTSRYSDDPFPLPLMREHLTTITSRGPDGETKRQNSQAVKQLEYKWEIPVVQKQVITNIPAKVLTQIGAISKQLQLEKLNFSDE